MSTLPSTELLYGLLDARTELYVALIKLAADGPLPPERLSQLAAAAMSRIVDLCSDPATFGSAADVTELDLASVTAMGVWAVAAMPAWDVPAENAAIAAAVAKYINDCERLFPNPARTNGEHL